MDSKVEVAMEKVIRIQDALIVGLRKQIKQLEEQVALLQTELEVRKQMSERL